MIKGLVFVLALTSSFSVYAERWQAVDAPVGSGAKWQAAVTNNAGHTLRIYRKIGRNGYEAFAELGLSGQKFADAMPVYQIDNGPREDTIVIKRAGDNLGHRWGYVNADRAGWRIWTSTDTTIRPGDALSPWLKGNQVTISYMTDKGKKQTTVFSLSGSSAAIKQTIASPFN